jgi:ElaB/YqjD/DUF883 family membrane-anchored ribosome-binding protein
MNDQQFENKVRQDTARVKKDLGTLAGDGTVQLTRMQNDIQQTAEGFGTWVEESAHDLNKDFEEVKSAARDTVSDAAATVKKEVGRGLKKYNAHAQELADKVPGGFSKKAAKYPWVTITIALVAGLWLGIAMRSSVQHLAKV